MPSTLKQRLGALLLDRPLCAWTLHWPRLARRLRRSWLDFHNRGERLLRSPDGRGYDCAWQWTSDLNSCRVFPWIGARLAAAALEEWPIGLADSFPPQPAAGPLVTFIIGHRGAEKIPHLLATLRSIFAQQDARVECLVVEQAREALLADRLPHGVKHIHSPPPTPEMPYSRAWAFNLGARFAQGEILVFHDNDILVPARYAAELVKCLARGYQAARLQRFVFYLPAADAAQVFASGQLPDRLAPELVRQNCEGHTLAVERRTYFDLGGHDESFLGWGGEDNEMFARCRTVKLDPYGYLPLVHLQHAPQPTRSDTRRITALFEQRMLIPAARRVEELSRRPFGLTTGPNLRPELAPGMTCS